MSDEEPFSIHRQAGMDEADCVTALVKMDRENRIAALHRLYLEIGMDDFQEALEIIKYAQNEGSRHVD